ncbi:hypothetical protein HYW17_05910 [Candidatus Uhrbacteria bacterium]|nr:hypothetical protein [Candidatus Uhrbacteria bacterium]
MAISEMNRNQELRIRNYGLSWLKRRFNPLIHYSLFIIPIVATFVAPLPARAETPADIAQLIETRQQQIAEIENQISEYWKQVDERKNKGASVQNDIEILKAKIAQSELEIRGLKLAIEQSGYKLKQTEAKIGEVTDKLQAARDRLGASLRFLRAREEAPLLLRFAEAQRLSEMFLALSELEQLHVGLKDVLGGLKETKGELEQIRDEIVEEKQAQERLKRIEESQKETVAKRKGQQTKLLAQIEKEKGKLIGTIATKKQDLDKIKEQITYLQQAGISAEEAVRFGELAAIRAGVRTSFLIAVLEVESRLGLNVGKGNWKKDMHPRDHEAFKAITAKLGRDPDTTPVSRAPSYGWGGAMGPAQFLPNTWMAYEGEVARLTGHNPPDPWNIEDAFTAAALKLARGGASSKTREGEMRASRAYIGGSPNCSRSICNYYANLVVDKAEDIEQELRK